MIPGRTLAAIKFLCFIRGITAGAETLTVQSRELAHAQPFGLGSALVEPSLRLIRGARNTEARVEPRVMQVLVALSRTKNALLSREDLRELCWSGRVTSDDAVDRVIAQIRRLGEGIGDGSFTVETIPKVGYRLIDGTDAGSTTETAQRLSRRALIGGSLIGGAALVGGIATYWPRHRTVSGRVGATTIAVLPFVPEGSSTDLSAFAAQLSDDVRSDISRVSDIRVTAQTSSRKAAEEGGTAVKIGRSIGADYLIEGQVGAANGQITTTVALVDTADGEQIWSTQQSTDVNQRSTLRSRVAGEVVGQLAGIIPISNEIAVPARRPDPQAYALVQNASALLEQARTGSMRGRPDSTLQLGERAELLANQALSIDPNYGAALAILATITRNGWTTALAKQSLTTEQRVQASILIVRRALLADPRDPAALTELGDYYRRFAFRWDEAENLFKRAIAINPSFVDAHWSYAYELGTLGRALEGLDHALTVFELDPRNPFRRIALPRLLYLLGQRRAAMQRYNVELKEQPDNLFLLRELYFLLLSEGNAADLGSLAERIGRIRQEPEIAALRRRVEAGKRALRGDPETLREMVDMDVAKFDRPEAIPNATPQGRARDDLPFIYAIEYAWAGSPEKSIDMLERALAAKSLYWPATLPFGIAEFPAAIRENPRFNALWDRDPGLRELVRRRRAAILTTQMAGFTAAGHKVIPIIPSTLSSRVRAALRDPD